MKTKILKLGAIILLCSLMGAGCEKDDTTQSVLDGKWLLTGFGEDSTNEFLTEPETEPQSSFVVFDNGEMVAFSVTNKTYDMSYKIAGEKINIVNSGGRTKVGGDTEWGLKFLMAINNIYKFGVNSELTLYYEDQKFMKFKKETK